MASIDTTNPNRVASQLIQHLSEPELCKLTSRTKVITAEKVAELAASLFSNEPFLDKRIWDPEQFEEIQMVSYKAFLDEKISLEQFVTCSFISYAFEQFQARFLKVTIDFSSPNKRRQIVSRDPQELTSTFKVLRHHERDEAIKRRIKTFVQKSYSNNEVNEQFIENLVNEHYQKLCNRMSEMPPSELSFFSYTMPLERLIEVSPMLNVLTKYVHLPFLEMEENVDEVSTITFPSYSLISTLLDVSNPGGIDLVPVFGRLTTRDIREYLLRGEIPINLKLPMAPLFKNEEPTQWADGFAAGPFGFTFHDIYHAWLKAKLSPEELKKAQGFIRTLVDYRKTLIQIRNQEKEMTDEIEGLLDQYFKHEEIGEKINKAISILNSDIWKLSDMDVKTLDIGSATNISSLYDYMSLLSKKIISTNKVKIGVSFNELNCPYS